MNANLCLLQFRRISLVGLILFLALAAAACGNVTPKNFAEGVRVMTGTGGTHQERDILGEVEPIARDMAAYCPKPFRATTLPADAIDILEELPGGGILVGTIQLDAVLANPSFGPLALYDAAEGRRLWESPRRKLPGGRYHLLSTAPVILVQGAERDSLSLSALDPSTGVSRWEWTAGRTAATAVDPRSENVAVAAADKKGIEIKALRLKDGAEAWRLALPAGEGEPSAPALLVAGDDVLLFSDRVARISMSTGRLLWEVPNPAGKTESRILPIGSGLLLWAENRVWMLKSGDGAVLWGPLDLEGDIRSLTVPDADSPAAYAMVRSRGAKSFSVRAVSIGDGKLLWRHAVKGPVESSLLPAGKRLFYSTRGSLEGLDAADGRLLFSTPLPADFSSRSSAVPDLLAPRAGKIVLSREKSGVAALDAENGKLLWARTVDIYAMADFWFSVHEESFHEAAGMAAQYKQMADKDRAWWNSYLYSWDRQWRTMDVGPSSPQASPGALSTSQWQASMALTNSLLALSAAVETGLRQGALNALAERKRLEMENSLALHSRSIQGRYWIRPFDKRGIGVTLVDLDTGHRADFEFSSPNYGMEKYGIRLPVFALAGGERLLTAGVALDTANWERYVKFKYGMPYPSVLTFRLSDLRFAPAVWDDTDLVRAAEKGDLARVNRLVEGGAWVDSRDIFGATPLMQAAAKGHDEVVTYLLAKGADPKRIVGGSAMTAVERAAFGGHASTVKLLIKAGADPDEAMRAAAKYDKPLVLAAILETGYRPPAASLRDAVLFGDAAAAAKFLDGGREVEAAMDKSGTTPLILAAGKGHLDVVRLLLDRGARINAQQKTSQKETALMKAAESGHTEVVRCLIEWGASVNARDADGMNAVFKAASGGHPDVLNLLIKAGGDIEAKTNLYKTTPLMEAAGLGKAGAVKVLLAAGASHSKTDRDGRTALSRAAYKGSVESVRALLAAGAKPDDADKDGSTPLLRAAEQGHLPAVKALLEGGANINAVNKSGKTVLASIKQFYWGSSVMKKQDMIRALEAAGAK